MFPSVLFGCVLKHLVASYVSSNQLNLVAVSKYIVFQNCKFIVVLGEKIFNKRILYFDVFPKARGWVMGSGRSVVYMAHL